MTADEFWSRLDRSGGADACWLFRGARTGRGGYANVWFEGRYWRGNRLVLYLTKGVIRQFALHTCDNPPCCNPRHVYDGSQRRNLLDCAERGRQRRAALRGSANPRAKLTSEAVGIIRATAVSYGYRRVLAERFGVTVGNIAQIRAGHTWN